jgi:hypothetical protein
LNNLTDLGFIKGTIGETIVSTYDLNGQPRAAPMGILMENDEQLTIKPFRTSLTYKNLQTKRCAVVNLTYNPQLFYLTTFKDLRLDEKLPDGMFEKAETIDAPRLKTADSTIEVSVAKTDSFSSERAEILCNVQLVKSSKALPKVYCRAQFATIEAIIHSTRIKLFIRGNKQQQKKAIQLLKLINICNDIVNRTAPNSIYSQIMTELDQMINLWRNKK